MSSTIGPLVLLAIILTSDAWVGWDAHTRQARGQVVTASFGPLTLDEPMHWLFACLLAWVVAFPLYLVARRA